MTTIYVGRNNPVEHQLEYSTPGSGARQSFKLGTATEIIVEFCEGTRKLLSFTDATHDGIVVKDEDKGIVEFTPRPTDFNNASTYKRINSMRWVVKNLQYPDGVVFGDPNIPIKISE